MKLSVNITILLKSQEYKTSVNTIFNKKCLKVKFKKIIVFLNRIVVQNPTLKQNFGNKLFSTI